MLVARFGPVARQREPGTDKNAEPETVIERKSIETCEIVCWRGYVKWQFHVKSRSPDAMSFSSPYFRAAGRREPEPSDAARRAHAALVEKLAAAGWERDGRGEDWFAERFQREVF